MKTRRRQIAIVGGGIAGLTFARCLDAERFECHIFEKKAEFGEIGAAISVFPNALCVMENLGLVGKIVAAGGVVEKIYLRVSNGAILSKSKPNYEYPTLCMHRADLHRILLEGNPATLYNDYALRGLRWLEDERVELSFENGVQRTFDAVVGADGMRSIVRACVLSDGEPLFRGYNVWRGVVRSSFADGYGSESFGLGKRFGIVPIKDDYYGWWAACNESLLQEDAPEGSKAKLLRLFGSWHEPVAELIQNTGLIIKNSVCDRMPVRGWTKGNATLLGDAAHPTTPNLGQGGCMAMEGAYLLAASLNKYGITPEAFQRYEDLHFPRAEMIVKESLRYGRIGQVSSPLVGKLRNAAFKLMPSSVAMKVVDKYFGYRVTSLVV